MGTVITSDGKADEKIKYYMQKSNRMYYQKKEYTIVCKKENMEEVIL